MSASVLRKTANAVLNTMVKLRRNEVSLNILWHVCTATDVSIGDIMDFVLTSKRSVNAWKSSLITVP